MKLIQNLTLLSLVVAAPTFAAPKPAKGSKTKATTAPAPVTPPPATTAAAAAEPAKPFKKWTIFNELTTTAVKNPDMAWKGALYTSATYKPEEKSNNSVGVETLNAVTYTGGVKFNHKYIRVYFDQANAFKLDGWKTKLRWRWYAPTNAGTHQAGGWGKIGIRPEVTREFGNFSLLARDLIQLHITDTSFNKYVAPGKTPGQTDLFTNALEVIPNYQFTKDLGLSLDAVLASIYNGKAGAKDAGFAGDFSWELALEYDGMKKLTKEYLDYVALTVSHDSPTAKFKIYSKAAEYNVKIGATF